MSYIDTNLMTNEVVAYRVRLHWAIFMPAIFSFIFAIVATFNNMRHFDWILYLITVALMATSLVSYLSSEFAVTNRRVIIKIGLISRNSYEMLLNRVEGIEVDQSIIARLLGYGNITVRGMGGSKEVFYKIENPLEFRKKVQEQIADLQAVQPQQ